MNILVTGATGTVGGEVLRLLLDDERQVRAVTRDAAMAEIPAGAETFEGDMTVAADVDRALSGIDRVFLNMADDNGEALIAGAARAGVEHVVLLSSFTAFVALPSGDENIVALRHVGGGGALTEAKVPFTALRAAGFDYNLLMWASDLSEGVVRAPSVDVRLPKVDPRDNAASAVAVLLDHAPSTATYTITGPEKISTREEVVTVGELLGRELRVEELGTADAAAVAFPEGTPEVVSRSVLETLGQDAGALQPTDDVERLTGRRARTFRDWAADHVQAFEGAKA